MISIENERKTPILWPGGSLAHRGQNPYGGNIWRVVWSESRDYMFKRAGDTKFTYLPMYRGKKCYVLERWISGWQYSKCGPETWKIMGHEDELGPYPAQGVYFGPCWEFSDGYPTLSAVETAIDLIERGDEYTDYERTLAVIQAAEREDQVNLAQARDVILESLPLNVTKGTFLPSAMKRAEDIPEKFSAQDILNQKGLPYGENKAFTTGAKRI